MDIILNRTVPRSARAEIHRAEHSAKPPMGGWLPGIAFTPLQLAVLNAFVDQLIPPGDGFPAPSEVDVAAFFGRYVSPSGVEPKWFPFIGEDSFRAWLDSLGEAFAEADSSEQVETIAAIERTQPDFFGTVRDMTYYAYYSRPAVISVINRELAAGKDLRNAPQPYGYSETTEEWDEKLFTDITGTYTRTEEVCRVAIPEAVRATSGEGTKSEHI